MLLLIRLPQQHNVVVLFYNIYLKFAYYSYIHVDLIVASTSTYCVTNTSLFSFYLYLTDLRHAYVYIGSNPSDDLYRVLGSLTKSSCMHQLSPLFSFLKMKCSWEEFQNLCYRLYLVLSLLLREEICDQRHIKYDPHE